MILKNYSLCIKVALLASYVGFSNGANILGIFFHGGRSHHILGEVLLKELARRGHNVTMVSPFPQKTSVANYTDIYLAEVLEDQKSREDIYLRMNRQSLAGLEVLPLTFTQVELTITNRDMKKLVNSGIKFDLIIIDWFFSYALLIYGDIFDAPVIGICSSGSSLASGITGNPLPPSFVPEISLPFLGNMTFLQRTINSVGHIAIMIIEYIDIAYHDGMLQKYFTNAPSYDQLRHRMTLIFSNSHYSFESPRPYVPNLIAVGGYHLEKPHELPKDLKKLIDGAKHGVIYFSLGSIMQSKNLPKETQQHIINAFSKIEQIILWKWEDENMPNLPKNVIVRKWLPQNDILAHSNVKLFITHGGILSTMEAIYHAKPVIGIPIFGDQKGNIFKAVESGYAVEVGLNDLTKETLLTAIKEIIDNPRYAENIQKLSILLKDRPVSPIETAVFWVEHVIRHKGAPHLKNSGVYLNWYQYLLLDVIVFLVVVISLSLFIIYFCIKKTCHVIKFLLLRKMKKD